jgi:hypothetical protein
MLVFELKEQFEAGSDAQGEGIWVAGCGESMVTVYCGNGLGSFNIRGNLFWRIGRTRASAARAG